MNDVSETGSNSSLKLFLLTSHTITYYASLFCWNWKAERGREQMSLKFSVQTTFFWCSKRKQDGWGLAQEGEVSSHPGVTHAHCQIPHQPRVEGHLLLWAGGPEDQSPDPSESNTLHQQMKITTKISELQMEFCGMNPSSEAGILNNVLTVRTREPGDECGSSSFV